MATKIGNQLTAALARMTKSAATEGPQRNPSTHPSADEPNRTMAPTTGEAETVMSSDIKKIPTPAIVDNATPPQTIKPDVLPAGGDKAARRKIGSLDDMFNVLAETLMKKADDTVPATEPNTTVEGGDKKYGPQIGMKQSPAGEDPKNETAGAAMTQKDHSPTTHPANLEGAPSEGVAFKSAAEKARALKADWEKQARLYAATVPGEQTVSQPATKTASFDVDTNVSNYLTAYGLAGLVDGNPDTMVKTAQDVSAPNIAEYAKTAYISAMRVVNFCKAAEDAAMPPDEKKEEPAEAPAPEAEAAPGGGGMGGEGGGDSEEILQNLIHGLLTAGMSEDQIMQLISGDAGGAGGGMPPEAAAGPAAGGAEMAPPPAAAPAGEPKMASAKNQKKANGLLTEMLSNIAKKR